MASRNSIRPNVGYILHLNFAFTPHGQIPAIQPALEYPSLIKVVIWEVAVGVVAVGVVADWLFNCTFTQTLFQRNFFFQRYILFLELICSFKHKYLSRSFVRSWWVDFLL